VTRFPRRIALMAAASTLALAACSSTGSAGSTATGSPPFPSTASGTASASGPVGVSSARITISNFAYSPVDLTVAPGATVTVTNHDSTTHTLTAHPGSAFNTGDIGPGKTASFTAPTTPGSYPYICLIHQFMHGTLTVS
jgi:plastocyanin